MPTEILLASGTRDRRRALAFVRRHTRQLYGGFPPPPEILFLAERNGRVCGTIALDFADDTQRFPVEFLYRIIYSQAPWPFERARIAQFGRWWATAPGIGVRLMHAAHLHALEAGKTLGLAEAKPQIVTRVKEFGMNLTEIPGAILQSREASSRGEGYYTTPPAPRLYMFDIGANAAALSRHVRSHKED
jgi:hypothetical protein